MKKSTTKYGIFGITAIAALLMISVVAYNAQTANAAPANKTMIGSSDLSVQPGNPHYVTIVSGIVKTSAPSDLIVSHNQECAIHTGLNLDFDNQDVTSAIRENVRLVIDGNIVPASYGDPITENEDGTFGVDGEGDVTFCGRAYHIDTNIITAISELCTGTELCTDADDLFFDSYIRTKQSHSWDWIVLDVGAGEHLLEIQAITEKNLDGMKTGSEKSKGKAVDAGDDSVDTILEIGKRNLIVVEDKLATGQES